MIILLFAVIACVVAFINYEAKQRNTNLQIELNKLKACCCNNYTKLDALPTKIDELEATIFDDLLNPMNEYVVSREHEDGVNVFSEKNNNKVI